MKVAFLFILTLSTLLALGQCFRGTKFEPLREFIRAKSLKNSVELVAEDVSTEYSAHTYVGVQDGLKGLDKILKLPGQPSVDFDQYSGYVTVDPKAGRALFYYFTEAEMSSSKPLVLWLNGGPGCSSIGNGAMAELGPFRVHPDGKTLWYNKYSWNNVANVLFLDSPAGVGFSYSNTSSDYITGDNKTTADSYTFLVNWLERFPEYKSREFYITGESYAGHYVPQLADLILRNNKVANQTIINLKGIAIGNAYTDLTDSMTGMYDYFWRRSLLSDETHQHIVQNCNFSSLSSISELCYSYLEQAYEEIGNIFFYDIYEPFCSSSSSDSFSSTGFDPCSFDYVGDYLNIPEVQKALHAHGTWESCNNDVGANWQDGPDTVLPLIKNLMTTGIRIWIYSGDTDGVVPVTTTIYSMSRLGSPIRTSWYPWYSQGEVGGYVVGYENVTFATVRGAGHFVPSYQPARALDLISSFLEGKLPPGLE